MNALHVTTTRDLKNLVAKSALILCRPNMDGVDTPFLRILPDHLYEKLLASVSRASDPSQTVR